MPSVISLRYVELIILCVIGLGNRPVGVCSNNETTPPSEYVVSPYYWPWSAAAAAATAGWHSPDHIISATSTFLMDLSFLSMCTGNRH